MSGIGRVTDGDRPTATHGRGSRTAAARRLRLLLSVAAVVLALDVVTKVLAVRLLTPDQPVSIIGDTVTWTLVRNSGRGVLDGHRLHLGAHVDRHGRGDRHRLDGPQAGVAVVGAWGSA